jgi:hypothetical protein
MAYHTKKGKKILGFIADWFNTPVVIFTWFEPEQSSGVDQLEQEEAQARAAEEEARRLEAERNAGFLGLLRRFAEGLGLSLLGNENNQVFRLQRSLFGFKIKTLDSQAMANNTPYKKTGIHPLAGVVSLANGRIVRITPR